jgi:putative oxidoreductase
MNLIQRMEHWGDTHHPKWIDCVRMVLGILLFMKAVEFMNNMDSLSALIGKSSFLSSISIGVMAHYVIMTQLVGGFLVAFGLLTRVACLIQIPNLLGALIFINVPSDLMSPSSSWWLSLLILVLLVFFLVEGGGPWSADRLLLSHPMKSK